MSELLDVSWHTIVLKKKHRRKAGAFFEADYPRFSTQNFGHVEPFFETLRKKQMKIYQNGIAV